MNIKVKVSGAKSTQRALSKVIDEAVSEVMEEVRDWTEETKDAIADKCPPGAVKDSFSMEWFQTGNRSAKGFIVTSAPKALDVLEKGAGFTIIRPRKGKVIVWERRPGDKPPPPGKEPSSKLEGEGKGAATWIFRPGKSPTPVVMPTYIEKRAELLERLVKRVKMVIDKAGRRHWRSLKTGRFVPKEG